MVVSFPRVLLTFHREDANVRLCPSTVALASLLNMLLRKQVYTLCFRPVGFHTRDSRCRL